MESHAQHLPRQLADFKISIGQALLALAAAAVQSAAEDWQPQ